MSAVIEDIKGRLDIVDVIGSYITLKKAGLNFKAVCPFHNEKTPSMVVSPQKQIWHCFGCGEGGDIFGFVKKYENLEFAEALRQLADRAGVTLPNDFVSNKSDDEAKKRIVRLNTFAAAYFARVLEKDPRAADARDYLVQRGLSQLTMKEWQVGYAPDSYTELSTELKKHDVTDKELIQSGLAVAGKIEPYDRFRGRITFPIHDHNGAVVGFSARALKESDGAKYINSPDSPAYNKSAILFGLDKAKAAIREKGFVIMVEGQMDVISAHQAGFANVVATSGTALTMGHVKILKRFSENLYLCFDTDQAGRTATYKAALIALPLGLKLKTVELEGGKDPDEVLKANPEDFREAVESANWLIDDYISFGLAAHAFGSLEQKRYVTEALLPLLNALPSAIDQDHYKQEISRQYNIATSALEQELKQTVPTPKEETRPEIIDDTSSQAKVLRQKDVLVGLLSAPDFYEEIKESLDPGDFSDPALAECLAEILANKPISDPALAAEVSFMLESLLEQFANNRVALHKELLKSFYHLKLTSIKERQQELTARIKQAELNGQNEELDQLTHTFSQLAAQRLQFESHL